MKITGLLLALIMVLTLASIATAEDVILGDTCNGDFTDVDAGNFFCLYIEKMKELGITTGYDDGTYRPGNNVTRGEMAGFIMRALELLTNNMYPFELSNSQYPTLRLNTTNLPSGIVDTTYSQDVVMTAGGGTPDYTFDCSLIENVTGTITAALLTGDGDATCTISGTPADSGRVTVKLKVTDSTPTAPNIDQRLISFDVYQSPQYTLTVNKSGAGTGTVTSSPAGINCAIDCSETYAEGTVVTLTAAPDTGSYFSGWSGGGCSGTGNCVVIMNADITVTAAFTELSTGIAYSDIPLTWDGSKYAGQYNNETIDPNPAQRFYKFTPPSACVDQVQIWLAGNIAATANVNMLVSDYDFGTEGDALSIYQQFLSTTGYDVYTEVTISGKTYWYWFTGSYESEFVYFFNPSPSVYYIELVNEDNFRGIYRISAYCW